VKAPDDGIYVNGLYIEGARWSADNKCLEEQMPGEMTLLMPVIHFLPIKKKVEGVGSVNQGLKIE
jgi:dynein heavy chain